MCLMGLSRLPGNIFFIAKTEDRMIQVFYGIVLFAECGRCVHGRFKYCNSSVSLSVRPVPPFLS